MKKIHIITLLTSILIFLVSLSFAQDFEHPNVILIITDDQGYGDLGYTGNPHVQTPVIDSFANESTRFNNFYVSPVCAPTRSSLMTGRYSLRTGVRDTYNGGAIMATHEITIAEMLKQANYRTGAFGKWHLGDNYPCRPNDQGFDETLIHLAGGMGQVGDVTNYYKRDSSYFDPVLWYNGKQKVYKGYCSDIFTQQAINFIEKNQRSGGTPFFCYLAFNAPHTPLQVPEAYYNLYKDIDPSQGFDDKRQPFVEMSEKDKEDARKVYGMVSNIDDNLGKLFAKLDELKITDNTLIIFMTDNGPQQVRYVAGLRGKKSDVYCGGVKVPFFLKYPARFEGNRDIDIPAAHYDILPTLAQICHVEMPMDRSIDGKSLLPLLEGDDIIWENRTMFFYWTRKYPELYNNIAMQSGPYKLVGHADHNSPITDFELFKLDDDPYEQMNILGDNKGVAEALKSEFDRVYAELITSENIKNPPRIVVGDRHENPSILNRNDAGGSRGIWAQEEIYGKWRVTINEGYYNIKFKFVNPVEVDGDMYLEAGSMVKKQKNKNEATDMIVMKNIYFSQQDCDFKPFYQINGKNIFPFYVELDKVN
ncbi:MAG: arylsulfatase [Thalassobius sp.]|nr:arylsulfatase [Thalassovita sp.]